MKRILYLFFFLFSQNLQAITCTAISNGNWGAAGSWSCGRAPLSNDTVVVPFGKTITININSPVYSTMVLKVFGTLFFNNGQKLNFDCASIVSVEATGVLDGGNPGSKIDMCGSTVWRGPGPDTGILIYGYNPLPINLLEFKAYFCEEKVCLNWTTLTETNNDFFSIDKTKDNIHFEPAAYVKGAGNSTNVLHYSTTDLQPYDGVSYYRLKQTDFNGAYSYYSLQMVEKGASSSFNLNLFPNPGSIREVNLSIQSESGKEVLVVVYDITGREAFSTIKVTERNGENVFALDPNGKLEKGIYFVIGTSDKRMESKKLIIN
jgi:Secretion system C-terminal sorting domain/G8 domain